MVIWGWMMRVHLGVGVPAPLCGYALVLAYPLHTEVLTVRVRLGAGVPALLCGYACLVAYPPLIAVFTLRVRHGEGLPAVYVKSYVAGSPLARRTRYSLRCSCGYALVWAYPLYGAGTPALWSPRWIIL